MDPSKHSQSVGFWLPDSARLGASGARGGDAKQERSSAIPPFILSVVLRVAHGMQTVPHNCGVLVSGLPNLLAWGRGGHKDRQNDWMLNARLQRCSGSETGRRPFSSPRRAFLDHSLSITGAALIVRIGFWALFFSKIVFMEP